VSVRLPKRRIIATGAIVAAALAMVGGSRAAVSEPVKTDAGLLSGTTAAAAGVRRSVTIFGQSAGAAIAAGLNGRSGSPTIAAC
jgi:hypothetical protein